MTHLMHAEDLILFFKVTAENCHHIQQAPEIYGKISGQFAIKLKSAFILVRTLPELLKKF